MHDFPIQNLVVAFVAGFAIQQLLEVVDPITSLVLTSPAWKKSALGVVSLLLGFWFASAGHIQILAALSANVSSSFDLFVTSVFISAGTEGFNSLLKFVNYKKEETKASAAAQKSGLTAQQLASVNLQH